MQHTTSTSRLTPQRIEDMRPEWANILSQIPGDFLKGAYAPVNVLGMLMYNPDTLGQFLDYWVTSKLKMGFTIREQELIILRMAMHYRCNYVWKHHVPVAKEFGVNEAELEAVKTVPLSPVFSAREEALLLLTDELVNNRDLSDSMWSTYCVQLKDSEIVDLISIVAQYVLFSLTNNVLRVELEASLADIPPLF